MGFPRMRSAPGLLLSAGSVVLAARGALADGLVRPGSVVVLLILGQDGTQVHLAEDQYPVQEFAAQRADEPLTDRVHPRSLDSGAQDRGPGRLEDGVERGGEVGAAVADQESDVPELLVEIQRQIAGLLDRPLAARMRVTPPRCIRRVPCSMNTSTYSRVSSTVSTWRKSTARIPAAWARMNCRHVGPERRGAGSMPAARKIS